jgi:hypothetical protein
MPVDNTIEEDVPTSGSVIEYMDNRNAVFISATYSHAQEMMEVSLQLINTSFDGVDTYYFVAAPKGVNLDALEVKEVFSDTLMTVIHIENIKTFTDKDVLELYFAPKFRPIEEMTDAETGTIILNKYNVRDGAIDLHKTKKQYLTERIDILILGYENTLIEQRAAYEKLTIEIENAVKRNEEIKNNEAFMTPDEVIAAEEQIVNNLNNITERTKECDIIAEEIANLEQKIEESKAVKSRL